MRSTPGFALISGCMAMLAAVAAPSLHAAPPTDACSLLTPEQVSGALGTAPGAGQPLMPNQTSICGWGQTGIGGKRVVASIYTQLGSRTPADRFTAVKTPVEGILKTPVSGVGDEAVSVTTPGMGTGLIVRKGASVFDVRVYGFPLDQIQAKEKALALDIVTKF